MDESNTSSDKEWLQFVRSAARSVTITVNNYTSQIMTGVQFELWHGVWRLFPTEKIDPYSSIKFAATNKGAMGGTEGMAIFRISSHHVSLKFEWVNPFVGVKTAKWSVDPPKNTIYTVAQTIDERHNMQIQWQIKETTQNNPISGVEPSTPRNSTPAPLISSNVAWKELQTKSSRSVTVLLRNTTRYVFKRVSSTIPFGTWSKFPPDSLDPTTLSEFGVRSENNVGGIGAAVTFQCEGETVSLNLENPLIGIPSFYATSSDHFSVSASSQKGIHSHVLFLISEKPNTQKPLQQKLTQSLTPSLTLPSSPSQVSRTISTDVKNLTGSSNLFGVPLEILIKKEKKQDNELPSIVYYICNFLENQGINNNNLFKEPGKFYEIVSIRRDFENYNVNSESCLAKYSPLSIAFVLKQFLQELPSPLIPSSMASYFVSFLVEDMADHISFVQFYSDFVSNMPKTNAVVLERICRLLYTLHYGPSNFNAQEGATVLGHIINLDKNSAQLSGPALQILIEHCPHIFPSLPNMQKKE